MNNKATETHIQLLKIIAGILRKEEFPRTWFFDDASSRCVIDMPSGDVIEFIKDDATHFVLRLNRSRANHTEGRPFDYVEFNGSKAGTIASTTFDLFVEKYRAFIADYWRSFLTMNISGN